MCDKIPAVLAIGSCRIFRPLRRLHEQGLIELVNREDHQWFNHSAAAARQFIDIAQGRKEVPEDLRAAAFETTIGYEAEMLGTIEGFDLALVEVSTLKEHRVGNVELNAHKVYHAALDLGIDYRALVNGDVSQVPGGHVLKDMEVTRASEESIAENIVEIRTRLGVPVVTVDHLYYEIDGTPIAERTMLTQILQSISEQHDVAFHSTRPVIEAHGESAALADSNHYRPEFEAVAGHSILESIRGALN